MKRNLLKEKNIYPVIKDDILPGMDIDYIKILKIFNITENKIVVHEDSIENAKKNWDDLVYKSKVINYAKNTEYVVFMKSDGYLYECEIKETPSEDIYLVSTDTHNYNEKSLTFLPSRPESFIVYENYKEFSDSITKMYNEKMKDYLNHFSQDIIQIMLHYIKINDSFYDKQKDDNDKKLQRDLKECFSETIKYVPGHMVHIIYKKASTTHYGILHYSSFDNNDELLVSIDMLPVNGDKLGEYILPVTFRCKKKLEPSLAIYEDDDVAIYYTENIMHYEFDKKYKK